MDPESPDDDSPDAAGHYVFAVRFRLATPEGVSVEPATFETTLFRAAAPPGESGWRFFRDNCWRGELSDSEHFAGLTEEALGVPVEDVAFRELRTTRAYLDALRGAIADDLSAFNADGVDEVLSKYLGSSIHVVEG